MKTFAKRTFSLLPVLALALGLAACTNTGSNAAAIPEKPISTPAAISEPQPETSLSGSASDSSTPAEFEYELYIVDFSNRLSNSLVELNEELNNMDQLGDEVWEASLLEHFHQIRTTCQKMVDYDTALVPTKYTETHRLFTLAATSLIESMDSFEYGVLNLDESSVYEAAQALMDGSDYLMQAAEEMLRAT